MKRVEFADTVYYGEVDENELPSGVGLLLKPGGGTVLGTFAGSTTANAPFLAYEGNGDVLMLGETVGTIFFASSGERYEGDFVSGERSGFGIYSWSDGTTFSGQFMKGKPHGLGMLQQRRGIMVLGEFIEGQSCGFGSRIHKDVTYQGGLRNGKRNGFGSSIDGRNTIRGEWKDDEIIAFGDCNGQVDEAISRALQAMNQITGTISASVQQTLHMVDSLRVQISKLCMQLNILRRKYDGSSHLADIDRNLDALAVALETRAGPDAIVHSLRADVNSPPSENSGRIAVEKSSPSSPLSFDQGENPAYYQPENSAIISTMRGMSRGEAGFFLQEGNRYTRSQGDVVPSPVTHVKKFLGQEIRDGSAFFYDDFAYMQEDDMLMKENLDASSFRNDGQIQHGQIQDEKDITQFDARQSVQPVAEFREQQELQLDANRFSGSDSRVNVAQNLLQSEGHELAFDERFARTSGSDFRPSVSQGPIQQEAQFHEKHEGGFDRESGVFSEIHPRPPLSHGQNRREADLAEQYVHGFGEGSNRFSGADSRSRLLYGQKRAETQQGPFYGELVGPNTVYQTFPANAGMGNISAARGGDFAPHFIQSEIARLGSSPPNFSVSANQTQFESVFHQQQPASYFNQPLVRAGDPVANSQHFKDARDSQFPSSMLERQESGEFRQMVLGQYLNRARNEIEGSHNSRDIPPYAYGHLERTGLQHTDTNAGEAFEYNMNFQAVSVPTTEMAYKKRSSTFGYESLREQEDNAEGKDWRNEPYSRTDIRLNPKGDHISWNQVGINSDHIQDQAESVRYSGQVGVRVSNVGSAFNDNVDVHHAHESSMFSPLKNVRKSISLNDDGDNEGFERLGPDPLLAASTTSSTGGLVQLQPLSGVVTFEANQQQYRELKKDLTYSNVSSDPNLHIVSGVGRIARRMEAAEERPSTLVSSEITRLLERRQGMGSYAELMISSEHQSELDDVLHRVIPHDQRQGESFTMLYNYKDSSTLDNSVGRSAKSANSKSSLFSPLNESAPAVMERRNSVLGPELSVEKGVAYAELMRGDSVGQTETGMGMHDMKIIRGIKTKSRSYLASDFQPLSVANSDSQMQASFIPSYNLSALDTGHSEDGALRLNRKSFSTVLDESVEKESGRQSVFGQLNFGNVADGSALQISATRRENVGILADQATYSSLNVQSGEPPLVIGRKVSNEALSDKFVHQHPARDDSVEFEPLNPGASSVQKGRGGIFSPTSSTSTAQPTSNIDITLVQSKRRVSDQIIIARRHRANISRPDGFDDNEQDRMDVEDVNPGFTMLRRERNSSRSKDQAARADQPEAGDQDDDGVMLEGAAFVKLRKNQTSAKDGSAFIIERSSENGGDVTHLRRDGVRTMRNSANEGNIEEQGDGDVKDNDSHPEASFIMLRGARGTGIDGYTSNSIRGLGDDIDFNQDDAGFTLLRRERASSRNRDQGRTNQSLLDDPEDQAEFGDDQQSATFIKLRRDQVSTKDNSPFLVKESGTESDFIKLRSGGARFMRNNDAEDNVPFAGDGIEDVDSNNNQPNASFIVLQGARRRGQDGRERIIGTQDPGEHADLHQGETEFTLLHKERASGKFNRSSIEDQQEDQYLFEPGQEPSGFIRLQRDRRPGKDEGRHEGEFARLRREGDQIPRNNELEVNIGEEDDIDIISGQSDASFIMLRGTQSRGLSEVVDLNQGQTGFTMLRRDQAESANQSMFGDKNEIQGTAEAGQMPLAFANLPTGRHASVFKVEADDSKDGFIHLRRGQTKAVRNGDSGHNFGTDDGDYESSNQPNASFIMLRGARARGQEGSTLDPGEDGRNKAGFTMLRRERASPRQASRANQAMLSNDHDEHQSTWHEGQQTAALVKLRKVSEKDRVALTAEGDGSEGGFTELRSVGLRNEWHREVGDGDDQYSENIDQPDTSFIMLRGSRGRGQERLGEDADLGHDGTEFTRLRRRRQKRPAEDVDSSHDETDFTMLRREGASPRHNIQGQNDDQDQLEDGQPPSAFVKLRKDQVSSGNQTRFNYKRGGSEDGFIGLRKGEGRPQQNHDIDDRVLNASDDADFGDYTNDSQPDASFILLRGTRGRGQEGRDQRSSRTLDGDADLSQGESGFTVLRTERASPRQSARSNQVKLGGEERDQDMFKSGHQSPIFVRPLRGQVADERGNPLVIEGHLHRGGPQSERNHDVGDNFPSADDDDDHDSNQPNDGFVMLRGARGSGYNVTRTNQAVGEDVELDESETGFTLLRGKRTARAAQSMLGDQDNDQGMSEKGQQPLAFIKLRQGGMSELDGFPSNIERGLQGGLTRLRRDPRRHEWSNDDEGSFVDNDADDYDDDNSLQPYFLMRGSRGGGLAAAHNSRSSTEKPGEGSDLTRVEPEFTMLRREQASRGRQGIEARTNGQDQNTYEDGQQPSTFVKLRKDKVSAKDGSPFMGKASGSEGGFTRLRKDGARTSINSDLEGNLSGADDNEEYDDDSIKPNESIVGLRGIRRRARESPSKSHSDDLDDDNADFGEDGTGFTVLHRERASYRQRGQVSRPHDQSVVQDSFHDGQLPSTFVRLHKDQVSSQNRIPSMTEESGNEAGFARLRKRVPQTEWDSDIEDNFVGAGDDYDEGEYDSNMNNQPDASFIKLRDAKRRAKQGHGRNTGDTRESVDFGQDEAGFTMLRRDRASHRKSGQFAAGQDEGMFDNDQQPSTFVRLRKDQVSTKDGSLIDEGRGNNGAFTRLQRGDDRVGRTSDIQGEFGAEYFDDNDNKQDSSTTKLRGVGARGYEPQEFDSSDEQTGFTMLRQERFSARSIQSKLGGNHADDQDKWQDDQQPSACIKLQKEQASFGDSSVMVEGDDNEGGFTQLRKGGARHDQKRSIGGNFTGAAADDDFDQPDSSFIMLQGACHRVQDSHRARATQIRDEVSEGQGETGFTMLRRERALSRRNNQARESDDQGDDPDLFEDGRQPSTFVKLRKGQVLAKSGSGFDGEDNEGGFTELQTGRRRRNERNRDNDDDLGNEEDNFDSNQPAASFIMLQGARRKRHEGHDQSSTRTPGTNFAQDSSGFTKLRAERASVRSNRSGLDEHYEDEDAFDSNQQPSTFIKLRKDQVPSKDGFPFAVDGARTARNSDFRDKFTGEDYDDDTSNNNNHPDASFLMFQGVRGRIQQGHDVDVDSFQGEGGFTMLRRDQASFRRKNQANSSRSGQDDESNGVSEANQESSAFIKLRKDQVSVKDGSPFIIDGPGGTKGEFSRLRRGDQNSLVEDRATDAHDPGGSDFTYVDLYAQQAQPHGKYQGQDTNHSSNAKNMVGARQISLKHPVGIASSSLNSSGQNPDAQSGMFGDLFKHSIGGVLDNATADSSTILGDLELAQSTGMVHAKSKGSESDSFTQTTMGILRNNIRSNNPGQINFEDGVNGSFIAGQDWNDSTYADFRKHQVKSRSNPMPKSLDDSSVIRNLWLRQLDTTEADGPTTKSSVFETPFISDSLALVEPHSSHLRTSRSEHSIGQVETSRQLSRGDSFLRQGSNTQSTIPFSNLAADHKSHNASRLLSEALKGSGLPTGQMDSSHSLFEKMSCTSSVSGESEIDSEQEEEEDNMNLLEASFEAKANFEDVRMGVFARRPRKGKTKVERRGESQVMHAQEKRDYSAKQEFAKPPPPPPLLPPKNNPLPPPADD